MGLLAGGAGCAPDAQRAALLAGLAGFGGQQVKVLGLTEEIGLVGGQQVDRLLRLGDLAGSLSNRR